MQGYGQLLSVRAAKTEDAFTINVLNKSNGVIKKLSTMISGFLNISSFEAGKIYLIKKSFDVDQLLQESIEEIRPIAADYEFCLMPSPSLSMYADRDKIGQVINNFLSNAVKYSPVNKTIEVSVTASATNVQIGVKDNGIGISVPDQAKLFSRYNRIKNVTTQHISGFGLGLYLCSEIIQRHDGEVWVESESDKGSTFYFSVPIPKDVPIA